MIGSGLKYFHPELNESLEVADFWAQKSASSESRLDAKLLP